MLYQSYCASCHKETGLGVEGNTPPLVQTKTVEDKAKLIKTVLKGLNEEIIVNGITYNQPMPSFHFLSDIELSKILTYVRTNFGNKYSEVDSKEVATNRK